MKNVAEIVLRQAYHQAVNWFVPVDVRKLLRLS